MSVFRRSVLLLAPLVAVLTLAGSASAVQGSTSSLLHYSNADCETVTQEITGGPAGQGVGIYGANFSSWLYADGPYCNNLNLQAQPGGLDMHQDVYIVFPGTSTQPILCNQGPDVQNTSWWAHSISTGYVVPAYPAQYVGNTGNCLIFRGWVQVYSTLTFGWFLNNQHQWVGGASWGPQVSLWG